MVLMMYMPFMRIQAADRGLIMSEYLYYVFRQANVSLSIWIYLSVKHIQLDNVQSVFQDDDAIGKSFSVPRHVFEKNAYATLILSLRKTWKLKWHTNQQELSRIQHDSLIIEVV